MVNHNTFKVISISLATRLRSGGIYHFAALQKFTAKSVGEEF